MRPTRRPSACPCGGRVVLRGTCWWCWACNAEVASRPRPTTKLTRTRIAPKAPAEKRDRVRLAAYGTPERLAWLHSLPCVAQGCPGHVCGPWDMEAGRAHIQAVHVRARGMGGAKGGVDDQVPGCWVLHEAAGEFGTPQRRALESATGLDLVVKAAEYARQWAEIEALQAGAARANVAR